MTVLVADTSGLVSLAIAADHPAAPLECCLGRYDVRLPEAVVSELREIASYDDAHGTAATAVIDELAAVTTRSVELDSEFPLDDGENAALSLANDVEAELLLCDEFNRLGLIHASLANTRLVTTPTLLSVFVRQGHLSRDDARAVLDAISSARTWGENSYVQRARTLFESE